MKLYDYLLSNFYNKYSNLFILDNNVSSSLVLMSNHITPNYLYVEQMVWILNKYLSWF